MSANFNNMPSQSQCANVRMRYNNARSNLLAVTAFTMLNVILSASGANFYMLFSAEVPYLIASSGRYIFEKYGSTTIFVIMISIAVILTVPYLLFWIFSKKHYGWMIAALVYFAFDCATLIFFLIKFFNSNMFFDILFHFWVLYYLIMGVIYGRRLQKQPAEPVPESVPADVTAYNAVDGTAPGSTVIENSVPIRAAENVKHRIYSEADASGHHIIYRKAGKHYELIIDGMVYAEHPYESWLALPHTMTAYLDGNKISAGYFGGRNFIIVNGKELAKSIRWI